MFSRDSYEVGPRSKIREAETCQAWTLDLFSAQRIRSYILRYVLRNTLTILAHCFYLVAGVGHSDQCLLESLRYHQCDLLQGVRRMLAGISALCLISETKHLGK